MNTVLQPGRNCSGFYAVDKSGLLIDARAYYEAFFDTAAAAESYILLVGWRFDTQIRLLRGAAAGKAGKPVAFLAFLNRLCEENEELEIYVLAWNFSLLYLQDREWFLEWKFNRSANRRIHFLFDNVHPLAASHHQKFAVIDGRIAFAGGIDFGIRTWDDPCHLPQNPDRVTPEGERYEAYHDLQAYFSGPAVKELVKLFLRRWSVAGGKEPALRSASPASKYRFKPSLEIPATRIALSQTASKTILPVQDSIAEIRNLFVDAIASAQELIYIENQYFTSQAIYRALADRMRSENRRSLQIVLILPIRMHTSVEQRSLGLTQMKMITSLRRIAHNTGHSFGVYWTSSDGKDAQTYIHSKLILVDDHFLTTGSANTTNRSLGLDSELNVSWEADRDKSRLQRAIRRARIKLLAEHVGLSRPFQCRPLYNGGELVSILDTYAQSPDFRLRFYNCDISGQGDWMHQSTVQQLIVDPEAPIIEETVFEQIRGNRSCLVARMVLQLNRLLKQRRKRFNAEEIVR